MRAIGRDEGSRASPRDPDHGSLIAQYRIKPDGQALPLLVAVIAMPSVGQNGSGSGLTGLRLGYFTIFDLGLGRATTKFVAEALEKGKKVGSQDHLDGGYGATIMALCSACAFWPHGPVG